jgi:oxaloacetate decarboxylase gamma subunit
MMRSRNSEAYRRYTLLEQGVELLVYGMGTVVFFLLLLVFATRLMSASITRWLPDPIPTSGHESTRGAPVSPPVEGVEPELAAAIAAAVHRYRSQRR